MYSKKSCIISLLVQCCKFLDYSLLTFELSETYPDVDQTEMIYINYLQQSLLGLFKTCH